jgi:hypothetical protein
MGTKSAPGIVCFIERSSIGIDYEFFKGVHRDD